MFSASWSSAAASSLLVEVAADDAHAAQRGDRAARARQRSGATTPGVTASASGKSATSAGNTSPTCFCSSWSVAVMPM